MKPSSVLKKVYPYFLGNKAVIPSNPSNANTIPVFNKYTNKVIL